MIQKPTCIYIALLSSLLIGPAARGCPEEATGAATVARGKSSVHIVTKREGDAIRFFVDNRESCEVTITLDLRLVNLKSDKPLPLVASFPPKEVTEAVVLEPESAGAGWEYSYTNYYKLGSCDARHDDSQRYLLPYLPGYRFKVTQGYNGPYSHKGSNRYAIDWKMPEGTIICAARGGEVVKIKEDSNTGGPDVKYDKFNNYVLIRHDDGTLGHYCHLQQSGALVKVGQRVVAGQPIALSGNTGYSSGPHLHFCVYQTRSGRQRLSVPVKFRTADSDQVTLVENGRYRAADIPLPIPVLVDTVAGEPSDVDGQGRGG
jgi:murein DD-endopeptidase MepM/ murein hydrolase activator NlpD